LSVGGFGPSSASAWAPGLAPKLMTSARLEPLASQGTPIEPKSSASESAWTPDLAPKLPRWRVPRGGTLLDFGFIASAETACPGGLRPPGPPRNHARGRLSRRGLGKPKGARGTHRVSTVAILAQGTRSDDALCAVLFYRPGFRIPPPPFTTVRNWVHAAGLGEYRNDTETTSQKQPHTPVRAGQEGWSAHP